MLLHTGSEQLRFGEFVGYGFTVEVNSVSLTGVCAEFTVPQVLVDG